VYSETSRISIWFFIGVLLLVYGLLITGAGIYDLIVPPNEQPVLAQLHAGIWWGGLLVALGGIYCYRFFPGRAHRKSSPESQSSGAGASGAKAQGL
jgi:hypothetical protein